MTDKLPILKPVAMRAYKQPQANTLSKSGEWYPGECAELNGEPPEIPIISGGQGRDDPNMIDTLIVLWCVLVLAAAGMVMGLLWWVMR